MNLEERINITELVRDAQDSINDCIETHFDLTKILIYGGVVVSKEGSLRLDIELGKYVVKSAGKKPKTIYEGNSLSKALNVLRLVPTSH
jgi:hypothetical protein